MKLSNTTAKAIRTAVQVLASGGFLAAINAALNSTGRYLPGNAKVAMLGVLTTVVALAHNALEDRGIIGTWLRRPSLTPAGIIKQAAKAAAAAQKQADQVLLVAAGSGIPGADPVADVLAAKLDALIAALPTVVAGIVATLPAQPAAPGTGPVVGDVPPAGPVA